jgi:alkanesulfonate monooxygenase SsuD/methylene tetrahydromethanopterin reductase-like flavin-dependent oxidoreductase (luciferase family)
MLRGIQGPDVVERSLKVRANADATPDALELARVYIETSRSMHFWFDEGLAFVGSPETVAAAIRAQRDRVGYDVLLLNHQFVDMPRDLYVKSMQLFGERVIPAFRG